MARVATLIKSANAGEWSPLLEGRIDLAKYPASVRSALNAVITPQGPTIRRSGTAKCAPVYDETLKSYLIPFIFDNDQALQIEAANLRMRFHFETGILARAPIAITATVADTFVKLTAPGHAAVVGDQVALAGFEYVRNLNGRIGNVTAVLGDDVTTDIPAPVAYGSLATATLARVYHIVSPYLAADVEEIRYVADQDTLFLFCDGYETRKLQRYGAYDWRLSLHEQRDGPFAPINDTSTTLTPSVATGNVVPIMADAVTGGTVTASSSAVGYDAWHLFDGDPETYWAPTTDQTGWAQFEFTAPTIVDGYVLEVSPDNTDINYNATDYAPADFVLEGSLDGVTYVALDRQVGYVLYDGGRSAYFRLKNTVAYSYYKLSITKNVRNGALRPRLARWLMTGPNSTPVTFTANAVTGINRDAGFATTDVGRLLRFEGGDGFWRWFKITEWVSTTVVKAQCKADPLTNFDRSTEWRLGLISATTGYPTCGVFHEDRLCMGGMFGYPDYIVASITGKYEAFSQTETDGSVSDDNALVLKLNARKQGRVMWISSDIRSLLVGTGSSEWSITSADPNAALSARTAKARQGSRRGSANVEPLQIDNQTLFVQRANRTMREMSYVFDVDGYRSPSMSLFSSHLGTPRFLQLEFAAEPHGLVFARRGDGTVVAITYNKEQDVSAAQVYDFNGIVESISVIPAADGTQDSLWLIVRRVIDGQTRRFIERLTRFWDFDSVILEAQFADCSSVYDGTPITNVYGLQDYVGQRVVGLYDGSPLTPVVVPATGMITLPEAASKIVIGLGYDSMVETSRPEAGAQDGTAQGKEKRIGGMKLRLWQTGGGEYAVRNKEGGITDFTSLEYLTPDTILGEPPALFTGDTKALDMPQAISTEGTVIYRQSGDIPLPMNVIAAMPTMVTQDP